MRSDAESHLTNPVIRGFAPDPSILRIGEEYYIATSTFTWFPGIRLHRSEDLQRWETVGHALTDTATLELSNLAADCGVWAPSLSRDPRSGRLEIAYSVVRSMAARTFDVDNYIVCADQVTGPWSAPVYVGSLGFDPSLFHDDDGRTWLVTLEWDPRAGYEHPGAIVLEGLDTDTYAPLGRPVRIYRGGTDRGCLEGPHLYRHEGWYYLMCAEGGTGYGHCVTVARASRITGPYEPDPTNPILSAVPYRYFGRNNADSQRLEHFQPGLPLQKAGHASLVEAQTGQWFVAYLVSRPEATAPLSLLGRETAIQEVAWTDDGWLRLRDGGTAPQPTSTGLLNHRSSPSAKRLAFVADFSSPDLDVELVSPREPVSPSWARRHADPPGLRLRGRQSLFSRTAVSLVAIRAQSTHLTVTTTLHFDPWHFSQSAGLVLYYDDRNFALLRVYWSETLGHRAVGLLMAVDGERVEARSLRQSLGDGPVHLRARVLGPIATIAWSCDGLNWIEPPETVDISHLTDERAHGFTGLMVGIAAQDGARRDMWADFTNFSAVPDDLDLRPRPPNGEAG